MSQPAPPSQCPAKPNGALCIRMFANHTTVNDVVGYLSSSESTLTAKTWRLELAAYGCDPGQGVKTRCTPSTTYPGPTRTGQPPESSSCRTANGTVLTGPPGCHNTLAQAMASHGDWSGLHSPTKTLASRTWFCVSEETQRNGTWQDPDATPTPRRACAVVG
jgi:hypothetical protein